MRNADLDDMRDQNYKEAVAAEWKEIRSMDEKKPQTTTEAFTIVVNGRRYNYPPRRPINYESIFALAYPDHKGLAPDGASITYHWKGEGDRERNGIIDRDTQIYADDGMVFNCYMTGNA